MIMSEDDFNRLRLVLREELAALVSVAAPAPVASPMDPLRLLSAEEMFERWGIHAPTEKLRLHKLAFRCRQRGLVALKGTRGINKRFALPDVLAAEKKAGAWRAAA